jgi:hypothetical protein
VELRVSEPVWIADVQVYPKVDTRSVTVTGSIGGTNARTRITLEVSGDGVRAAIATEAGRGGAFSAEVSLGAGASLWDEFTPVLHTLSS